jgi:hypothetical protein
MTSSKSNPSYLHPDYAIGRPGCSICVYGWVRFSPHADPADLRRITQLDVSCLTRWRPCVSQIEVMQGAWNQYLADHSRLDDDQTVSDCSPSMPVVMGRDSTQIVTVSVIDSRPSTNGTIVRARVTELIKGSTLRIGETLEWSTLEYPRITDSVPEINSRVLLFLGLNAHAPKVYPPAACRESSADAITLNEVRIGIAQDYLPPSVRTYPR